MRGIVIGAAAAVILVILAVLPANGATPGTISFQGILLGSDGNPVPDDVYTIVFSIWDDSTGGTQYWTETQTAQTNAGGLNVAVGDVNAIDYEGFPENGFLQIQVGGDPPMTPRISLSSVPYSFFTKRIMGDVESLPGFLRVRESESDLVDVQLEASGDQGNMAIIDGNFERFAIGVSPSSSGMSLAIPNATGGNLGKLLVGVDNVETSLGIEHEDIGASLTAKADSHEVAVSLGIESDDLGNRMKIFADPGLVGISMSDSGTNKTSHLDLTADSSGGGLFAVESFFDVVYTIDFHTTENEAAERIQADDALNSFSRLDLTTPSLYQATCSGSHENGHSFIIQSIDNQGSSGEYKWMPDIGDEVIVGFNADSAGAQLHLSNIGSSGEDGVSINVNDSASTCGIEHEDIGGTISFANSSADADGACHEVGHNLSQYEFSAADIKADSGSAGLLMVDSFFDIICDISSQVSDTGSFRRIRASDGVNITKREDSATPHLFQELCDGNFGNDKTIILRKAGETGAETELHWIPEVGDEVLVGAKADTGGAQITISNIGSSGEDGVSASADSNGSRIALYREPTGDVPIEIVALSIVQSEPVIVVRKPDALPTDLPQMEYFYDNLDRLTLSMRDTDPAPGDSIRTGSNGFHLYDGTSELHLDTRGLFFSDPTGPLFTVSPSGETSSRGGAILAQNSGTSVGIGGPSTGFKLYVDGDVCATGNYLSCSDLRFKKNINEIDSPMEKIKRLRGVNFDWRKGEFPERNFSDDRQLGMIAQEVMEVAPEAVSQDKDGYYSVDYARLVPILVEAVKEQQKTIESMQKRLEENDNLRAQLDELKSVVLKLAAEEHLSNKTKTENTSY